MCYNDGNGCANYDGVEDSGDQVDDDDDGVDGDNDDGSIDGDDDICNDEDSDGIANGEIIMIMIISITSFLCKLTIFLLLQGCTKECYEPFSQQNQAV